MSTPQSPPDPRARLTREDWAVAALDAISRQGVSGVAVEPLAARLGATKGSFYWHFAARDELVAAALEIWETRSTADVIDRVEALGGSAEDRLRQLMALVFDPQALTGADVALMAHLTDPEVRRVVERVSSARIDYIIRLLRQAGLTPAVARRRAVFAYSAFLGHLQLIRHTPELVHELVGPTQRYVDEVLRALLTRP
jgi:AcrR family transcriptional regulator